MKKIFIAILVIVTASCSTPPPLEKKASAPDMIRVDSRGCMTSARESRAPTPPLAPYDVPTIENYYEKLEYYYLLSAEQCFSNEKKCTHFEATTESLKQLLLSPTASDPDVQLSLKHSNNKLLAMMAINTLFYQKKYSKNLGLGIWLLEQSHANDLTQETTTVRVRDATHAFLAHNMATTSARTFMYVGLLENNIRLQQKALSQIPHVLKTKRADGSLPIESRRGSRGLRYSMQVLSDLVALLALGDSKNLMYTKNRKALLNLAQFDLLVLQNNGVISQYASENFSPGPINDHTKQDISSLRSRLAWVLLLNKIEKGYLDKVEHTTIDKTACSESFLKNKLECSPHIQSIEDLVESPLGFTLGFNPRCVSVDLITDRATKWAQ